MNFFCKNFVKRFFWKLKFFETGMAGVMASFGLVLLGPSSTFLSSPSYQVMANVAVEWFWGILCLGIAAAQFFGMACNNNLLRRGGLLLATGFWALASAMFGVSNIAATGWTTYAWQCVFTLFLFLKVGAH